MRAWVREKLTAAPGVLCHECRERPGTHFLFVEHDDGSLTRALRCLACLEPAATLYGLEVSSGDS